MSDSPKNFYLTIDFNIETTPKSQKLIKMDTFRRCFISNNTEIAQYKASNEAIFFNFSIIDFLEWTQILNLH